ncbi:MAG TPA: shikimate kinase [Lentimicrobium sp.]|nr:shikimate kinase [Lentimicrobium sp.]
MGKPVFLIGYMGSGKSTAGKKLANRLKFDFVDVDAAIEQMTGKPVAKIFSDEGEDQFRQLEHSIIKSLTARKNVVIATGGGAPCFFDNIQLMNSKGVTVYLKMAPGALAKRIIESKSERPLLKYVANEDLPAYINIHLQQREVYYKRAEIVVDGENLKIDELSQLVLKYI